MYPLIFFIILSISNLHFSKSQLQKPKVLSSFSISNSSWTPTENQILLSPNSTFAAGFLPLPSSPNLYTFSVWYYGITENNATIVWTANYDSPVNSSASLIIKPTGELSLSTLSGKNLWPSRPVSRRNTTALILQESGNLVFGDWASFDYPTTTILPNQNITNAKRVLSSMNGKFKFNESKELVYNGDPDYYWTADNAFLKVDDQGRISKENFQSFISSDLGDQKLRRLTLDEDGNLRLYSYDSSLDQWATVWQAVFNLCQIKGTCGANAICMYETSDSSTSCVCPPGFKKSSHDSCERKIPLTDLKNSNFFRLEYVNFTGAANSSSIQDLTLSDCQAKCLAEDNCQGFQFKYDGKNDCILLMERLDYGLWSPGTETVMFLRVDSSETDENPEFTGMTTLMETACPVTIKLPLPPEESRATTRNIVIITTIFAAELISGIFFFWAFLKKYTKYRDMAWTFGLEVMPAGGLKKFSYAELKDATKNFSDVIGKGGFGTVYKGVLGDGRVVAVKALKNVAGGDADFWAEVNIIARMHHLNLVRLWGFCTEKNRRLLVYEHVPNGSLDKFIFQRDLVNLDLDESPQELADRKPVLDWNIRYRIALGVARAIAYLHEECLEWVLHCDIKPENILLGDDFCPKVSDFGLAKLKKKEDIVTKSRFRGTPGYLAPEWLRPEPITSKSDVYSFGLVLLEIVAGKRNFDQQNSEVDSHEWYFPSWAFDKVFKEMNVDDILDPIIKHSYDSTAHFDMVNRMVKTAMWCLQDRAENRPTMGKVAKMLEGTVEIIEPKRPTIFFIRDEDDKSINVAISMTQTQPIDTLSK
ncbi:G-type lectin S-receptor-like serine/threonine-protein kinase At1g34300 [Coffea arabica]|uniref:Receptor-like serine/threonine-protein kinase n=1 Tax=Coffea arabica TaxID=13443 RepID=A0A6P6UY23_COFAR|nr:G-type lectin S-receptor-like serine/threonine-protein kinase At1g34300 [Coffea arabica]